LGKNPNKTLSLEIWRNFVSQQSKGKSWQSNYPTCEFQGFNIKVLHLSTKMVYSKFFRIIEESKKEKGTTGTS
jgi:hypothetical protein